MRPWKRSLLVAGFAASVSLASLVGSAAAADDRFDITGTVLEVRNDHTLVILTSDLGGKARPITVDVSYLKGLQVTPNTPIQLTIMPREYDSYLATQIVRESPYVNGAEFGVQEWMTTRQDSIQAGVGNVPEDDEALNQQHRSNDLHHRNDKEEDDDKDNRSNR
jgi:hypothetical protein